MEEDRTCLEKRAEHYVEYTAKDYWSEILQEVYMDIAKRQREIDEREWQKRETALRKKAADAYCKVCGHYHHTVPAHICRQDCDYYKRFINEIEELP